MLFLLPGCGLLFQLYAGYDEEETQTEKATHTILVSSLPRGAQVSELVGDRRVSLGITPLEKKVDFEREVDLQRPASMKPFWIGTAVDLLAVIGAGILVSSVIAPLVDNEDDKKAIWGIYANLPIALLAEAAVGGIVGGRPATVVKRRDLPEGIDLALSRPGGAEIQAHIEIPAAGSRLTIPLDPLAARAMNRVGAPVTLIVAKTSSISIIRTSTIGRGVR